MGIFEFQYGRAATFSVPIIKAGSTNFAVGADWTPVNGDVKVSIDGGTANNIGTLPSAVAVGNAAEWLFTLTAGELTGKRIRIAIADAATKAVEDDFILITTIDHPDAWITNGVSHYGVAAGGTTASLTFASSAPNDSDIYDDYFRGHLVRIRHGGLTVIGTLAISGVSALKFKTTSTLSFRKAGANGTKTATDNLVFSAADTINTGAAAGLYWGAWAVTYDGTSAFATQSPSADQVYASEALALAAAKALTPSSGTFVVGYITVECLTGQDWVANTDDMTPASGCNDSNFYDAALLGTFPEEEADIAGYTASTRVGTLGQTLLRPIVTNVDEYWTISASRVPSVSDIAVAANAEIEGGQVGTDATAAAALMTTALTEAYATDGSTATPAQLFYMIWSLMAEKSVSGTTITAKKLDGSTTSMTFTINDASTPTSITRAS